MAIQYTLNLEVWGDGGPLKVRIALHCGTAEERDSDYFGRTVNVAARVESLAGADEVVVSWSAFADGDVAAFVEECAKNGDRILHDKKPVKGVEGEVAIVRIAVKP